jgi:hypothetical protein
MAIPGRRRKDTAGHVGRVFDCLREHFGSIGVFRNVDRLKPGHDFEESRARRKFMRRFIVANGRGWLEQRNH